jgi:hypothetical protein
MYGLRPFQRADRFQIAQMAYDMIVRENSAGAKNVPRDVGDLYRLSNIVELGNGYLGVPCPVFIQESPDT